MKAKNLKTNHPLRYSVYLKSFALCSLFGEIILCSRMGNDDIVNYTD